MDGTILSQGTFTVGATVVPKYIAVPSGTDWVEVINWTQRWVDGGAAAFSNTNYWQIGMLPGSSLVSYYGNGDAIFHGDLITSGGISIYDPSGNNPYALPLVGVSVATTASTNATRPVVSTANTGALAVGSVVRLSNTGQTDLNGIDFVVGAVTPNVSFTLLTATNPLANVPGAVGGAGFYRQVNNTELFYPRKRVIVNITNAVFPQVSTSIAHGLTVGQEVRFLIPAVSGMVNLNGVQAAIVSVLDDYNFFVDFSTVFFPAFTFPTVAQQPSSYPEVVPVGENTAVSLQSPVAQTPTIGGVQINGTQSGILADSTVNTGFLGLILGTGGNGVNLGADITGPAGSVAGDFIMWRSGKSSYGGQ